MLIPSSRHTREDLALWANLRRADLANAKAPRMAKLVQRAKGAIAEFASSGPFYVSTSWGKDSVVVVDLILGMCPAIPVRHLRVEHSHNPHCDGVRDEFVRRWPDADYAEYAITYASVPRGVIGEDYDRETDRIWHAGFKAIERDANTDRHASGVRAEESTVRALRTWRWGENTGKTSAPIARWSTADVFAYLAANDLPVHPNYAMLGGGRWPRERLRVAEIGDSHGRAGGRREWEAEYYGDIANRLNHG